jgi:Sulfotransferase family
MCAMIVRRASAKSIDSHAGNVQEARDGKDTTMTGSIAVAPLVDEATRRAGLADFGPDTWQEGLDVLVRSLNTEAALTGHGEAVLAERIVAQLVERLRFEASWKAHPEIAEEQIVAPVFGVGLGRTGSNALGFMMAQDPARRMIRMWEALYPAPPPETAREHADPRIARTQAWIEGMWRDFPAYKDMVPLAAEGPTECVYLLQFDFRTQNFEAWGRVPSYHDWLFACDMAPAYAYHKRILQMLQWQCGPRNWFLRSPPHMHAMTALGQTYPDARFVQTHRNVDDMIPSEAALFSSLLTSLTREPDEAYLGRHLAQARVECLKRLLAFRDAHPDRFYDIGFYDMAADPICTIRAFYAWLGEVLSHEAEARMRAWWQANSSERQGARSYVPEQFGVTASELKDRFAFYHARFPQLTAKPARR